MIIYTLISPETQVGEVWGLSKKQCCFGNLRAMDSKVLSLSV